MNQQIFGYLASTWAVRHANVWADFHCKRILSGRFPTRPRGLHDAFRSLGRVSAAREAKKRKH
jgi:hypothetical protein